MKLHRKTTTALALLSAALLTAGVLRTHVTPVAAAAKPLGAMPAAGRAAAEAGDLDFDLLNKTGYSLKKVLIAPSAAPDWDEDDDVLKGRKLGDGEVLHITFSPKAKATKWDMKVVYSIDGSSHEWTELKLDEINKITLFYNADKDETHAKIE
jgi:hypothetical protein